MRVMADGGYRLYLDVPEDELGAVMQLILLRKDYLRITVTIDEGHAPTRKRKAARSRPRATTAAEWGDDGDEEETDADDNTG